jgi:F0F1-type ATP synthase, subunit b
MAAGPQTTHSETGHPHEGKEPFPPFNTANFPSQILWFVISFGVLYLVMSRVALPRMKKIIDQRAGKIESDLAEAQRMQDEAREAAAAYEKTLAEARARSQELANATRAKVKAEQAARRQSIEAELDQKLKTAEAQIAETKASAMTNVGQIANEAAQPLSNTSPASRPTRRPSPPPLPRCEHER